MARPWWAVNQTAQYYFENNCIKAIDDRWED